MSRAGIAQASHKPAPTRPNLDWQERANCADANPRIFFDRDRYTEALSFCAPCPVKRQCRESRHASDEGVWGGRVYGRRPGRPRGVV